MDEIYQGIPIDELVDNPFFAPLVEVDGYLQRMSELLDSLGSNSRKAASQKDALKEVKQLANIDIFHAGRPYRDYIKALQEEKERKLVEQPALEYVA